MSDSAVLLEGQSTFKSAVLTFSPEPVLIFKSSDVLKSSSQNQSGSLGGGFEGLNFFVRLESICVL